MAYASIPNLYQDPSVITLFKEVYYLEKIHGTSANVEWNNGKLKFFPGCVKQGRFEGLFNHEDLRDRFEKLGHSNVIVYGEAYGASVLKQAHRYGSELRFVAFEVLIGDSWLNVPNAEDVAKQLGLSFVPYVKGPATLNFANLQRDLHSVQAALNGVEEPQLREGVVIRPMIELTKNNGERIKAKHKGKAFQETATPREANLDPEKIKVLSDANEVAEEWATEMRLVHVMDKLQTGGVELELKDTSMVIKAMIADIKKECGEEISWTTATPKAIGKKTALMFKKSISKIPLE